ncbi:uncharacterized protein LOC131167548 [Malania oleifera]|uniref:uncharacterized protein LOC131167548 n=1 Tax=Malania oleifera TaxID=397392 RepID=UPI0025AE525D|nr:uncharacterized protein LOC131167548 [Malania oleifera]
MGTSLQQITLMVDFLVINRPSAYNIIMGHPSLNATRVVTSTYHLKVKFPTPHGMRMIKGDQSATRNCYVMVLKGKNEAWKALTIEDLEVKGEGPQIVLIDKDLMNIPINGNQERCVQIGSRKKRSFALKRIKVIDEEVTKLVQAKFIKEVSYPEWINNVVLVKNPNGKWRTCIDFTDLNKTCPKDSFPLPHID